MSLPAGTKLGPYTIISLLGAGGMGEVYRARDARLGREVAVKTLPSQISTHPDQLLRFEREARAASALNHPNVVTVHDVGREGEISYIAMELVDGSSLRDLLDDAPMPFRRLLPIAAQVADGLAAAHDRGIVHRDLKPENIMVERQGRVKILDFGLAKDVSPPPSDEASPTITMEQEGTREGTILGTAGYMSPEQASGKPAGFPSDQFSFGAILYEMASGARAFRGDTPVETLSAVIREEPAPLRERVPETPAPFSWLVERCLAKEPSDRYASTRDLARDLSALRDHVSHAGSSLALANAAPPPRWGARPIAAILAVGLAALAAALVFLARRAPRVEPAFSQLTFRRGTVLTARFAPDGDTIVYGAAWEGRPFEIFSTRGTAIESRALKISPSSTDLLSISSTGEMAVAVNRRAEGGFVFSGTLARASLSGGAPREILENVIEADWTPDGKDLTVTRRTPAGFTLELPAGKRIFSTPGWIGQPRVSPRGDAIAFIHHPVLGDDRGEIVLADRGGRSRVLTRGWSSVQGLAWRPDGKEVWFSASQTGVNRGLNAVTLEGRVRGVSRMAAALVLQDISRSGRVLVTRTDLPVSLFVGAPDAPREIDATWLDASIVRDISADGKMVVFTEAGQGGGPACSVFVRRLDDPYATRLGDGWAEGISADGRSVLAITLGKARALVRYPVGAGEARGIAHPGISGEQWAAWLPDGKRIAFAGREAGKETRIYVQDSEGGAARPVTPEGVAVLEIEFAGVSLSPDGKWVAVGSPDGALTLYPIEGGAPKKLGAALPREAAVGWSRDGSAVLVTATNGVPANVSRIAIATGERTPFRDLSPVDVAGVTAIAPIVFAPDGRAYAYCCLKYLSTLFVADGLH